MVVADKDSPPDLDYRIVSQGASFSIVRDGQSPRCGTDTDDALFLLEKDITVELQRRRTDLLFLHSAAIEWRGKVCLLAAEAGGGKSTTSWALLHHGFRYLSDELSPIDLNSMEVAPYPHALCLKRRPASPYLLPQQAIDLGRTIHVPVPCLPSAVITAPRPLGAVMLIRYSPEHSAPDLRRISAAEASARLYVTALNALSHPNRGLDAVVRIAERVPCFALDSADLPVTCALVRSAAEEAIQGGVSTSKEPTS